MSLDDEIAAIWRRSLPAVRERLALVDAAAASPADATKRAQAAAAAHKLAGSLGSFGKPGSAEAAALEAELRAELPDPARVEALRGALHAHLDAELA